jgi:DNA-binding GntR family transcriptional regulator
MSPDHTYRKIADDLRRDILSGKLGPGANLPSQKELVERYGVARMTARKALGELVNDGLITSRQGLGSTVREVQHMIYRPQAEFEPRVSSQMDRFMAALTQEGREPTQTIEIAVVPATPLIAERLHLEVGDPAVARKRIRYIDGQPFNINDTYYDFKLASPTEIMNPADIPRGSNNVLRDLGYEEIRAIDEFYIRMPDQDEVKRLNLSSGTPVACHIATGYTVNNHPTRCDVFILPGDRHVILYERVHPENHDDPPLDLV